MSKKDEKNIAQKLIGGIEDFLIDITKGFTEDTREELLSDLGLEGSMPDIPENVKNSIGQYRRSALADELKKLDTLNTILSDYGLGPVKKENDKPGIPEKSSAALDKFAFLSALNDAKNLYKSIKELIKGSNLDIGSEVTHQILHVMTLNYIRVRWPFLYWIAQPLGFIEETVSIHGSGESTWERFKNIFKDPWHYLKKTSLKTEDGTRVLSDITLLPLGLTLSFWEKLFGFIDFDLPDRKVIYGWDIFEGESPENGPSVADLISNRALSFKFIDQLNDEKEEDEVTGKGSINATLIWVPKEHGGPGLFISLAGAGEVKMPLKKNWEMKVALGSASAISFFISRDGKIEGPSDVKASIEIIAKKESGDPYYFPNNPDNDSKGSCVKFGSFSFKGEVSSSDVGIKFLAKESALVLDGSEGDGFLEKILPAGKTPIDFSFGIGLSAKRGIYLDSGGDPQATLPVSKSIGPLKIHSLTLGLGPEDSEKQGSFNFDVGASMEIKLGPVTATIDQIGFGLNVKLPKKDGRIALEDTEVDLGFKPPKGVGLVIDAGTVVGGGYLFLDHDNERYAGAIQLKFTKFELSAVGLLTTIYEPDGSKDYSLLIVISSDDFTPINLGLGFTLNGVGGLLGVNRTVKVKELQSGLKSRILDTVLFPSNPVSNAPRIISDMRKVFPPKSDQHVFGPVAMIGWGTPTVITAELGIIMEFPAPLRLIILGQIRALLPSPKKPLVKINMDAIGVIDFDNEEISIAATLYDSNISKFILSGDMALQARWGDDPVFLLAIGGFNPRFPQPAGFPKLERLSLSLSKGNNPRLRLETYLALTSNTVQFGARIDVYVKKLSFSLEGNLEFHALFQFSPFSFIVDFGGGVTVKWRGHTLLSIQLEMTLSGPSPWHVRGKARVKIWIFSKSISFDKTFGPDKKPPSLPIADPMPELLNALNDTRNWSAQLPGERQMSVSLRDRPEISDLLIHPRGELTVKQQVVPLGIEISKFGNTRPDSDCRFTISDIEFNDKPTEEEDKEVVTDFFAPAQFIEMSDSRKLSHPSFEKMQAGLRFKTDEVTYGGMEDKDEGKNNISATTTMDYECTIITEKGTSNEKETYTLLDEEVDALTQMGADGRSTGRNIGNAKYRGLKPDSLVEEPDYVIASTDDLSEEEECKEHAGKRMSYSEAYLAMCHYCAGKPERKKNVQVITRYKTEGAIVQ